MVSKNKASSVPQRSNGIQTSRGKKQLPGRKKLTKTSDGNETETDSSFSLLQMSKNNVAYGFLVVALAVAVGILHSQHVSGMFESERFFSHLSTLERELSFRTEMGLYYSYYKTIAEAETLTDGVKSIISCNITEYPSTVNVLRRFNLYPELALGAAYRVFNWISERYKINTKVCYTVNRGPNLPPVQSCEGMGDIAHFYVFPIFWLSGLMMSLFFLFGTYLSNSIFGGIIAVACYFYNHGEATRVMWTPPLRESFSFPFLISQMLCLVYVIRTSKVRWTHAMFLCLTTLWFMLPWQFAQFALLTQVCALSALYMLKFISGDKFSLILYALLGAHILNFVFQFANTLLMSSFFFSATITALIIVKLEDYIEKLPNRILILLVQGIGFLLGTFSIKILIAKVFQIKDDAHIFAILKSKFSSYRDFHTMLYTCAPEFDFIEAETPGKLTSTLLLPCSLVCCLAVFFKVASSEWEYWRGTSNEDSSEIAEEEKEEICSTKPHAEHLYIVLQALAFVFMSIIIMRLKLFGTPALCLICSLMASRELFPFFKNKYQQQAVVIAILAAMSVQGFANLKRQFNIKGEYSNADLEQLVEWVKAETPRDAVFAGAMPTMATIKLTTQRAIVNHPHYEDAGLRERTKKVYQIYSRKLPSEVHATLKKMQVTHVVLEESWCVRRFRPGCGIPEVWDLEDPANRDRRACCSILRTNPAPFKMSFQNQVYTVLAV